MHYIVCIVKKQWEWESVKEEEKENREKSEIITPIYYYIIALFSNNRNIFDKIKALLVSLGLS